MSHRVVELHCIMPIENLPSVFQHGILCHDRAEKFPHKSVALQDIQDRRVGKTVPNGLRLHQYANLYFYARNPMMYRRKDVRQDLCVIRISLDVLTRPNAVVSDQNAASDWVRFHSYPDGMGKINFDFIFADWWDDEDQATGYRKKAVKCAEALIPDAVAPSYINGFYACDNETKRKVERVLAGLNWQVPVTSNPHLFFR
ncbi:MULTISPECIES: DUF4433 domain-containing protein [Pseudomonas]|uniref:DUF4433 domain-containing protein n=1 Tax=Pseudomonas TaxID=286 RepID=UPI001304ED26|nr:MULTISPECIES: DUF4433 domain-containing protein [Pseudomonas]QXN51645.1 DUF4433 domain-containing protein [Pseudomonas fluorescens]WSO25966.1 DUF4433 domain-containing protein [Pseudomonas fluorescens]